jgi:hypothetical protein
MRTEPQDAIHTSGGIIHIQYCTRRCTVYSVTVPYDIRSFVLYLKTAPMMMFNNCPVTNRDPVGTPHFRRLAQKTSAHYFRLASFTNLLASLLVLNPPSPLVPLTLLFPPPSHLSLPCKAVGNDCQLRAGNRRAPASLRSSPIFQYPTAAMWINLTQH